MAEKTGVGGLNLVLIFALASNAFGNTPVMTFDRVKDYTRTGHPKKKNVKINFNAYIDNDVLLEHLGTYLSEDASTDASVAEVEYDDGTKEFGGAASSSAPRFGVIAYESKFGSLVKTFTGIGTYTGATGDMKAAARTANAIPIEITTVKAEATTTLVVGCHSTAKVTPAGASPATLSIPAGEVGILESITSA